MPLTYLSQADAAVADVLRQELTRERDSVGLIAWRTLRHLPLWKQ